MTARLSRHVFTLLVSNLGGALLSFILSALIGRALGTDGLGVYAVALAWVFPLALLVDFGLSTLLTRDLAADPHATAETLPLAALARLILGGTAVILLFLAAPLLSDDARIVTGIRISAPLAVIMPFYSLFTAAYKAYGAMWPVPYLNIGMLAAQVILTAIVFARGEGVLAALIVNTATSAGQLAAAWLIYRWRFYTPGALGADALPRMSALLRKALPFALAALFAVLQVRLSVILLERLSSAAEAGFFSAANRFVEAARLFPNAFFGALFPLLAALSADPAEMQTAFHRAMRGLALFGAAAALSGWLLAAWAVTLVYGESFAPAAPVLQALMLSLLFSVLRGGRTLYWYAHGREGFVNGVNGVVIALQTIISLLVIPSTGAAGAAWAHVIVEAAGLALLWRSDLPGAALRAGRAALRWGYDER